MRLSAAITFLALAATPAFAGATAWADLGPGVKLRIVSSDKLSADGTTLAALELDMPSGTKTYWRVPGETGIPTTLDTAGSTAIAGHRLLWPYPVIDHQDGYTDFVYYGPTVVPLELKVGGDAPVLKASIVMGICSEVCMPAMAEFTLPLDFTKADAGQDIRISQALANTPIDWTGPGEPVGQPVFDATAGVLEVPVDTAEIDPESVIADASETGHLFGAPQKSREPGVVALPLLGGDEAGGLDGKSVTFIFMTPNGPFEVAKPVKASTPPAS